MLLEEKKNNNEFSVFGFCFTSLFCFQTMDGDTSIEYSSLINMQTYALKVDDISERKKQRLCSSIIKVIVVVKWDRLRLSDDDVDARGTKWKYSESLGRLWDRKPEQDLKIWSFMLLELLILVFLEKKEH